MHINKRNISRGYIALAILAWLSISGIEILQLMSSDAMPIYIPNILKSVCVNVFLVAIMLFFKLEIGTIQSLNFRDLLWKTFLTSAAGILVITLIKLAFGFIDETFVENQTIVKSVFYNINAAAATVFLANSFYVFKRLVLYQKTRRLQQIWSVFETCIYGLIVLNFLEISHFNSIFIWVAAPFAFWSIIISFNLRWIPYLNFNQKWQCILLLFLIMAISVIFFDFYWDYEHTTAHTIDITQNLFSLNIFIFTFLYCLISFLVLLFNLPTSSVFEQKFEEVLGFQKMSQTIQLEKDEAKIYNVLFRSCFNTVAANAGWLEIIDEKWNISNLITENISRDVVFKIKTTLRKGGIKIYSESYLAKNLAKVAHGEELKYFPFNSLLTIPLYSNGERIGSIGLLKNVKDGFDKEIIDIIKTYIAQASVSIHNSRLMNKALDNERNKVKLSVARTMQQRLLPKIVDNKNIDIAVYYEPAEEVGGDYYDYVESHNKTVSIAVGDVSGKSTSAAFNMAQLKGVFHTLADFELAPDNFLCYANRALSKCLEKGSFVTLIVLHIDFQRKMLQIARAGHCPAILHRAETDTTDFIEQEGMGLGVIRTAHYENFVEKVSIPFKSGDSLLLYTDGITEARDNSLEEFGYENLKEVFHKNAKYKSEEIIAKIRTEVSKFTGNRPAEDDYTMMVIKFI